jgi:hypothetical protein
LEADKTILGDVVSALFLVTLCGMLFLAEAGKYPMFLQASSARFTELSRSIHRFTQNRNCII